MIINANALHIPLKDGTVQCCVTSPPYYGLRDYGTAKWIGGDPECDHKEKTARNDGGRVNTSGFHGSSKIDSNKGEMNYKGVCPKCGAIRKDDQIGLEPTPDEYVAKLVQVFREVKRVLKDDGVLWLNLGDSYTSDGYKRNSVKLGSGIQADQRAKNPDYEKQTASRGSRTYWNCGVKAKDLLGIPWMVAFALRADGWYLRSDIIWAKPNPMPESVKDRPTKAHEYLFLLSKSQRYYYDAEAIAEQSVIGNTTTETKTVGKKHAQGNRYSGNNGHNLGQCDGLRNKRTVWTITTQPFKGAHFAVMPEKLVEPCVLAGSRPGDLILDPFAGSGTVGVVAQKLGRAFVGVELNPEYVKLAEARLIQTPVCLFNSVVLEDV